MSVKVDILWRVYLVFFCVCAFGAAIIVQAYRVQTVRGDYWRAQADSVYVKFRPIESNRGNIYSADKRLLATTLPTFDIRMDLKSDGLSDEVFRNQVVALSQKLASVFPYQSAKAWERQLTNARNRGERYHLIRRKVSYDLMLAMRTWPIWERGQYKGGLIVIEHSSRKAPFGELALRTIGYAKSEKDSVSGVGLEYAFHQELKGEKGQRLERRIPGGTWIPVNDDYAMVPENGADLITTIDVNVQDVAESTLYDVLQENNAEWGCAIVMEVETGKIKAIANLSENKHGGYSESYNYAIGYAGEPGSTMKLATLAALIEDGHLTISDSVDLHNGRVKLGRRTITDSEGWHPYRNVTVQKAFERSSNVAFTTLADKYYKKNPEAFLKHLHTFHFDQTLGIEIDGEKKPFYRTPGDNGWSSMSIQSLAFGYELSMTPLQMLSFYNAIANNGKMMKPYLVEAIHKNGQVKREFNPIVLQSQICSQNTVDQLKACLEGVVETGTGRSLRSNDYKAAGKTGTTKLAVPGASYGKYYTASFVGYFPAENPKYSCIVVVNKPRGGKYYGGSVAGPVFKAIGDMLYSSSFDRQEPLNKDHLPDSLKSEPVFIAGHSQKVSDLLSLYDAKLNHNSPFVRFTQNGSDAIVLEHNQVPDVVGMAIDDALYLLENAGLKVKYSGSGLVKSQSIQSGESMLKGNTIYLQLQ